MRDWHSSDRRLAAGVFVVATAVALVGNAALHLALDAVAVRSLGGAPWWVTAGVVERGRWVAFAALLWAIAPRLTPLAASFGAESQSKGETWRQVGLAVLAVPLLWVLATWLVSAARFTALGSWTTEGRVFLAAEYYRGLLVDYAPWLMAGAAVRGIARHV